MSKYEYRQVASLMYQYRHQSGQAAPSLSQPYHCQARLWPQASEKCWQACHNGFHEGFAGNQESTRQPTASVHHAHQTPHHEFQHGWQALLAPDGQAHHLCETETAMAAAPQASQAIDQSMKRQDHGFASKKPEAGQSDAVQSHQSSQAQARDIHP